MHSHATFGGLVCSKSCSIEPLNHFRDQADNRCHACANRQIAKEQTPGTGINIPIPGGHNDVELSQSPQSRLARLPTESAPNHLASTKHNRSPARLPSLASASGGSRILAAPFEAVKRVESLLFFFQKRPKTLNTPCPDTLGVRVNQPFSSRLAVGGVEHYG